jgi:CelD/BcsL family acetyltransferase involved in cellulose biosynthesis
MQAPNGSRKINVTVLRSLSEVSALAGEWAALAEEHGQGNPFVHPDWLMAWAERFLRKSDQIWLFAARQEGKLVGVAPYYRRSRAGGLAHSMQLWGAGRLGKFIELPALLAEQGQSRAVVRSLVRELCGHSKAWDWAYVPLPHPVWFEPDWLPKGGSITVLSGMVRACVVRPVSGSQPFTLKRNIRESLRRAHNRLDRSFPGQWRVDCAGGRDEIAAALKDLVCLHTARSQIAGKEFHDNVFGDDSELRFLSAVLETSSARGGACIYRLMVQDRPIAALLVLRTKECSYFSLSGVSREGWDYSPVTLLQGQAIDDAIKLGQSFVNFSVGPNTSKLRWSEEISVQSEFLLIPNRRLSAGFFGGYWMALAGTTLRREQRQHKLLAKQHGDETGEP